MLSFKTYEWLITQSLCSCISGIPESGRYPECPAIGCGPNLSKLSVSVVGGPYV